LIFDGKGALYGTTEGGGGSSNCGTVFKLKPPAAGETQWTEKVLYSFAGTGDGCLPMYGRLIFDSEGALYGTTQGTTRVIGAAPSGVVFKLAPPAAGHMWTETVLYSFKGGSDGSRPWAGLIFDSKGALYGTTLEGGGGLLVAPPAAARCSSSSRRPRVSRNGPRRCSIVSRHGRRRRAAPQGRVSTYGRALWHDIRGQEYTARHGVQLKPPAPGLTQWARRC
jgi:uncharacterized repeat protein (TIGR03803 family)